MTDCIFCRILEGDAPAQFVGGGNRGPVVAFEPLNPVTPGHLLVVPRIHVQDAYEHAALTGETFAHAALLASTFGRYDRRFRSVNLITSVGSPATQTVMHLHVHIVPRVEGDRLQLPWTDQLAPPRPGLIPGLVRGDGVCHCDGPPHAWSPGWCPSDGPVREVRDDPAG